MIGGYRGHSHASAFVHFALVLVIPFVGLTGVHSELFTESEQSRLTSIGKLSNTHLRKHVDRYLAELCATVSTLARFADFNSDSLSA